MTKWVCPIHNVVVLYLDSGKQQDQEVAAIRVSKPAYCDQCKKSYYKYECKEVKK